MPEALKIALLELRAAMFKVSKEAGDSGVMETDLEDLIIKNYPFKTDLTEMAHHVSDWVENFLL